jgi:hypothetical protein
MLMIFINPIFLAKQAFSWCYCKHLIHIIHMVSYI